MTRRDTPAPEGLGNTTLCEGCGQTRVRPPAERCALCQRESRAASRTACDALTREAEALGLYAPRVNQCDGCRAGMPLEWGLHINRAAPGWDRLHMVCTADRYADGDRALRGTVAERDEGGA